MLVACVAYQNGSKLADIGKRDIHSYLARPDCFVWVALADADPAELHDMQREFDLHPLAVEDALHGHQRPKLEEYGDSLFAVLHLLEPEGDDLAVGEVNVFIGANYVLSVRSRSPKGFAEVRARCEREPALLARGPGYVLYALMDAVVDRYFPVLDEIETRFDEVEQRIFAGKSTRTNITSLYGLRQELMALKHAAGSLLEAVGKLAAGGRVPQRCQGLQEYFRDVYDHLLRLNASMDSLRDMATTAMNVNLSMITLQENEVTKRLAAYAALVAVPTLIAGIYGMNFKVMPELSLSYGYPVTLAVMAGIDFWLFRRFRKAGWL